MLLRAVGLGLFFICSGLWVLLLLGAAVWVIPWALLTFVMGFMSNARPWPELKHWLVWKWLRQDYFRFQQVGNVFVNERCIYAVYPHGHYALTHVFYFALNPVFASVRPAIHSWVFYIPLFGTLARWIDAIEVTEDAMLSTLHHQSIIMCPGGIADTFHEGTRTATKHSGFLRVARKAGVKVVPVWCPAERGFFTHYLPIGRWTECWFRLPLPFITLGRWFVPFLPAIPGSGCPVRIGAALDPADEDGFWKALEELKE
jgi:hypothetical protein